MGSSHNLILLCDTTHAPTTACLPCAITCREELLKHHCIVSLAPCMLMVLQIVRLLAPRRKTAVGSCTRTTVILKLSQLPRSMSQPISCQIRGALDSAADCCDLASLDSVVDKGKIIPLPQTESLQNIGEGVMGRCVPNDLQQTQSWVRNRCNVGRVYQSGS